MWRFQHQHVWQKSCIQRKTWNECIQNFKHKKTFGGVWKSKCSKLLFMGAKVFVHAINKGDAFSIYVFPNQVFHINMVSLFIQNIQGYVLKEECWHLAITLTIWLYNWFWKRCATSIHTHLQFVTRWIHDTLKIHWWKFWNWVHLTFQIST